MLTSHKTLLSQNRRRGVAGIIIALLFFAMLFTAGVGYYAFLISESASGNRATATSQNLAQAQGAEQLSLSVKSGVSPYASDLVLTANNTGGVSSTIVAVFVENSDDQIVSSSTSNNSPYLVSSSDLSINLPLALAVGASTNFLTCTSYIPGTSTSGSGNCEIAINPLSCTAPSCTPTCTPLAPIFIYVLTSDGNTFGAEYLPPSCMINLGTSTTTSAVTTTSTTSSVVSSSESTTISGTTTLVSSSTTNGGLAAGTNSLLVTLAACPGSALSCTTASTVYQGGEVLLTGTVENFSPVSMSVYLNLVTARTNAVSVSPESPNSCTGGISGSVTVPADSSVPIQCTYSANQGASGGTVTFIGWAEGTYTPTTGCPCSPITITSAESTSNPQQIGNTAASITGPWSINYFSFNYQSYQEKTATPLSIISASGNSYVSFQVSVTNTANSSLVILQYSYLLVGRIAQEMDFYVVQSVNYPNSGNPTATAFACTPNAPSTPTGTSCTGNTVGVGSTANMIFAACYPGSNSWEWQNTGGGNPGSGSCGGSNGNNNGGFAPPEGVTMFVDIVYAQQISGSWVTLSQTLPFYGVFVD